MSFFAFCRAPLGVSFFSRETSVRCTLPIVRYTYPRQRIAIDAVIRTQESTRNKVPKAASRDIFLAGCSSPAVDSPGTSPRFALGARECLSAQFKHDALRPEIAEIRGSVVIRVRPCMTMSTTLWDCVQHRPTDEKQPQKNTELFYPKIQHRLAPPTPPTPHHARLVGENPKYSVPGMRVSMVIRLRPCMISSTPRPRTPSVFSLTYRTRRHLHGLGAAKKIGVRKCVQRRGLLCLALGCVAVFCANG